MKKCFQLPALQTGRLLFLVFLLLFAVNKTAAQDSSQTSPKFLIGSFIHSSSDMHFTQYNNYQQILELGLNSVYQIAVKDVPRLDQYRNLDSLALFPYVMAANDSGTGAGNELLNAEPENIDWISYFTQAKYTKWEAEGSPVFTETDSPSVRVKYDIGSEYTEGNISGRRSGINQADTGKFLIRGPDYWQYPRYTFTNPGNGTIIYYKALFKMKIDFPSETELPVCEISVTAYNTLTGTEEETLASRVLTTNDLSTEYGYFELIYNYYGLFDLPEGNLNYPPPPTSYPIGPNGIEAGLSLNEGSKVQFKVKWLGNRELFVDYIEVYDQKFWENYFIDRYSDLVDSIYYYDQSFATSEPPEFYEKLKYYGTIDEPGSIDSYEPLRKVQFLLDSLNINADLLIHWYPGWDGYRDGDPNWPVYYKLAQPKQLMFWYFPYWVDVTDEFGLEQLRAQLSNAHEQQPGFFLVTQSWGWLRNDGSYARWRAPNPPELKAEVMLALAHGVQGIIYEPYYSYRSNPDTVVTGLVDTMVNGSFQPKDIYYAAQELNSRLNNMLGNTLVKLDYTSNYNMLRIIPDYNAAVTKIPYLNFSASYDSVNFHAGEFISDSLPQSNYFLLTNIYTNGNRTATLNINDNGSSYQNTRFRNIESEYNFDTTFVDSINIAYDFPAGEGYLFQAAPVVKYGGALIVNDTLSTNETLIDDMIIRDGVELLNGKSYTIEDTVTLEGTGFIKGSGYIYHTENGGIITSRWDRSLFKSRSGDNPHIFWGNHPAIQNVISYNIYRKKGSPAFQLIATVSDTITEYTDTTVTIITGGSQSNETIAEYYVTANWIPSKMQVETSPTNTIKYERVEGSDIYKKGANPTIQFTYKLEQNYPNPFNPSTIIDYSIKNAGVVTIKIYDILGREIRTLVNENKPAGSYKVEFNGYSLPSGVYLYKFKAGKYVDVKKMLLLK